MEGSLPPTGRSMTAKSTVSSNLRVCPRKHSKQERSGWHDASTPLARLLAGSQNRALAHGGIFPGIWATCWRTFRTLGHRGIRVSDCRPRDWFESFGATGQVDESLRYKVKNAELTERRHPSLL